MRTFLTAVFIFSTLAALFLFWIAALMSSEGQPIANLSPYFIGAVSVSFCSSIFAMLFPERFR